MKLMLSRINNSNNNNNNVVQYTIGPSIGFVAVAFNFVYRSVLCVGWIDFLKWFPPCSCGTMWWGVILF